MVCIIQIHIKFNKSGIHQLKMPHASKRYFTTVPYQWPSPFNNTVTVIVLVGDILTLWQVIKLLDDTCSTVKQQRRRVMTRPPVQQHRRGMTRLPVQQRRRGMTRLPVQQHRRGMTRLPVQQHRRIYCDPPVYFTLIERKDFFN